MNTLLQDIRYALRAMRHAPGFSIVATLALALGIGVNTAIFSIVYGVLLKPLPFPDPSHLATVMMAKNGEPIESQSLPDFSDFRSQNATFEKLAGYSQTSLAMSDGTESQAVPAALVTADIFAALGIQPARGRSFTDADDAKGAPRVLVIGDGLWARRFNRDPTAIGRTIRLNSQQYTIVGIMPSSFEFPIQAERIELWTPMRTIPFVEGFAEQRGAHFMSVLGRLKPRVTIAQAQADLQTIAARLAQANPGSNAGRDARVLPLQENLVGEYKVAFAVLLGAVAFVLLIACANVANLLLARGAARQREIAVRLALGASRRRLISQLLTESVLLSVVGGALGLLLAVWSIAMLTSVVPEDIPRLKSVTIDPAVLAFTAIVSLATGILFGLAPALQTSRGDVTDALKDTARGSSGRAGRLRRLLVANEVALAVILLVGAGLLLRSFIELRRTNPGFSPEHVLTVDLALPEAQYSSNEKIVSFYTTLLAKLAAIPGVERRGIATTLPMSGGNIGLSFTIDGRPAPDPKEKPVAIYYGINPDFIPTLGIRLIRGRLFTDTDAVVTKPTVALVSESMARKFWPGADPIGQRITLGDTRMSREIVGIVNDVKAEGLADTSAIQVYVLFPQQPWPFMSVAVRTAGDPLAVASALRARILEVDPGMPVEKMTAMTDYVSRSVAEPRFNSLLLASFSGLALLLSALGIYGVMAYTVAQRTREIGIRMALGANPAAVLRLIVSEGMRTAGVGIAIGLAGAAALSQVLGSLLYRVAARDLLTFSLVAAGLTVVAFGACYLPARRATRISPTVALRAE